MTASGGRRIVSREVSVKQPIRYAAPQGAEAEFEPGSRGRVLRNLLGIRTSRAIGQAEYEALLKAKSEYMARMGPGTCFTADLVCRMHRDWLGHIYAWAGQYRSVDLQKGEFRWPPAYLVPQNMARLEAGLMRRHTPCRPGPLLEVCSRIAQIHAELLLIHPFRDGNGRLARWLAEIMAAQAGLPIPDYGFTGRGSGARHRQYLVAVTQGYVGNYDLLAAFFAEAVERRLGR